MTELNLFNNNDNDFDYLCGFIAQYAEKSKHTNTITAVNIMEQFIAEGFISKLKYQHALMLCRMMIDLNMRLETHEEDILLASAICHILPEEAEKGNEEDFFLNKCKLDSEVYATVSLLNLAVTASDDNIEEACSKIQENKLAFLIAVTDRANMVEQLHINYYWQIRKFIYETRRYYYSMCIYAKEHYHDLLSPIDILLEKLRNLTDVSEILLTKFEAMEIELTQEMLSLKEENATMRGIIKKLKNS